MARVREGRLFHELPRPVNRKVLDIHSDRSSLTELQFQQRGRHASSCLVVDSEVDELEGVLKEERNHGRLLIGVVIVAAFESTVPYGFDTRAQ